MNVESLSGDDVVFMYASLNAATYAEYGCTFLAWGGANNEATVCELRDAGIRSTGSFWCLTAGAKELHGRADLLDAVCRDIEDKPIPVWWLFDQTHQGTATYFGCTNHPAFRAFLRQRCKDEMSGGADGLHIDDHLGTAHSVAFLGGCFCHFCMAAFRQWMLTHRTREMQSVVGDTDLGAFDFQTHARQFAATDFEYRAIKESIPMYPEFLDCQLQLAAENVRDLGILAAEVAGHSISLSANTALPELPHLAVTPMVTHLVGEVPHHAELGTASLLDAVHAYRMAEAVGKPLAATARGQDWAFVKATGCVDLVKVWIALSYCCGQRLMAPHRQWCFTMDRGSDWYDGPGNEYAPLYRFVRKNRDLFRGTQTLGPLAIPDELLTELSTSSGRSEFEAGLKHAKPVQIQNGRGWLFPRRATDGGLLVHFLNLDYSPETDGLTPIRDVTIAMDSFGDPIERGKLFSFDSEPIDLSIEADASKISFTLPKLRLWSVLRIG